MTPLAKIIFMGTPGFAVPSLKALVAAGFKIAAVVTQPDRPVGRGRGKLQAPPVKVAAEEAGIEVLQPLKIRGEDFADKIRSLEPDFIAVVAYGKILPGEVLDIPRGGCVNLHASLLPKYRGAAPINRAIINGDRQTGVCTILMDEGMDTGPVLLSETVEIKEGETALDLTKRLSEIGAPLLVKTIGLLIEGKAAPLKQDGKKASYSPALKKEDGLIDWSKGAAELDCLIRGVYPWPGAYTVWKKQVLKIHDATAIEDNAGDNLEGEVPGTVIKVNKKSFSVKCGRGALQVNEVQPENKKRLKAGDFIAGYRISKGEALG